MGMPTRKELNSPTPAQFQQLHAQMMRYAAEIKTLTETERIKSRELEIAHQQLLNYARDLRTTYKAERQRARELSASYVESIHLLSHAAEFKDEATAKHIRRISNYAKVIALIQGWSEDQAQLIFDASPMHDIGKIGVPDAILLKPGPLNDAEWVVMKRHPVIGESILSGSNSPLLRMAAEIAVGHHERWDGSGYPKGLQGEAIPEAARIVMLCDVYDALRSKRPYKPAFDHDKSCDIILNGDERIHPNHFAPGLLEIFAKNHSKFAEIFADSADA